MAVLPKEK